jgi:DNA-binding NtrC family response regulator
MIERDVAVLLIEDDAVLGESLVQRLTLEGYGVAWARSLTEGEVLLRRCRPAMIVCDMQLPDGSGEALLLRLLPSIGSTPVVVVTAFGEVGQAVRLMRAGADDYVEKPFEPRLLLDKLRRAKAIALPEAPAIDMDESSVAPTMQTLDAMLRRLAPVDSTVLLLGESGAGKEVAAERLHMLGRAQQGPFVAVNCAAIPADLFESEVFGHERGAFTGAMQRHQGFAERAGKGTLFLDEIGDLPLPLQAKLLRLIQDRRFQRLGGRETLTLGARIVAATNADLAARVAEGRFREDLYFRLAVVPLEVPPLRQRPDDIRRLALSFTAHFGETFGRRGVVIDDQALDALLSHDWPGNVRELRNRIERALVIAEASTLGIEDLFPDKQPVSASGMSLIEARETAEREHIRRTLSRCGGRIAEAAQVLGISRTTMWERMRRLGLGGDISDRTKTS